MKLSIPSRPIGRLAVVLGFFLLRHLAFAQGSLTPPGAPAPTMKSLDQIEARTPISSLPYTISTGGSYYLTKSMNVASGDAIAISASGVTLDLNGFEITSTDSSRSKSAIVINSALNSIQIKNGSIRSSVTVSGGTISGDGFASAVSTVFFTPANLRISHLSVAGCVDGIVPTVGVVEYCDVSNVADTAIYADSVSHCHCVNYGFQGINANYLASDCYVNVGTGGGQLSSIVGQTVVGCVALGSPASGGAVIKAQVARDCYAQVTSGGGAAISSVVAKNCYAQISSGSGNALSTSTAENCRGQALSGIGINASQSALNCYGTSTGANAGVSATVIENSYSVTTGSGNGLVATASVKNCYGATSTGQSGIMAPVVESSYGLSTSSAGITATTVANSFGGPLPGGSFNPNNGIAATAVTNSVGTGRGAGISANQIVSYSSGTSLAGGVGVSSNNTAFACPGGVATAHAYFCGSGPAVYP